MRTRTTWLAGLIVLSAAALVGFQGCSSDDSGTTPAGGAGTAGSTQDGSTEGSAGQAGAAGGGGAAGQAGAAGAAGEAGAAGSAGGGGDAASFEILDPSVPQFSKTYAEWGAEWWKWVYENPGPQHPLADTTGADCAVNQPTGMFFLAGTSGGVVTRTCTVPAGKPLFFPLINLAADNGGVPQADWMTDQALQDYTKNIEGTTDLFLEIDGTVIGSTVAAFASYLTPMQKFAYTVPDTADNYYRKVGGTDFAGLVDPSYTRGYYIMLAPPPAGTHTIHFKAGVGEVDAGGFALEVTYNLTIQ
jgi:hypothetical protein